MEDRRYVIPDLPAIRRQRGVSLQGIADSTKIRLFYLEAIEKGRFDKLPAAPYARSYIRQYAQAIDFDESELLRALPPDPESAHPPAARPTLWRRIRGFVSSVLPGGAVNARRTT